MTIITDLILPESCPCCGAGVRREVVEQESGGPTLTRTYGPADDARHCGAVLSTHRLRQAEGRPPNVIAGCREQLIKLLGGDNRSPEALPPFEVDDNARRALAATSARAAA